MRKKEIEEKTPARLLADLVKRCKKDRKVRALAQRLDIERQTIYLWDKEDSLTHRAAKLRLLEISRLRVEELAEIVSFAKDCVLAMEAAESGESQ